MHFRIEMYALFLRRKQSGENNIKMICNFTKGIDSSLEIAYNNTGLADANYSPREKANE